MLSQTVFSFRLCVYAFKLIGELLLIISYELCVLHNYMKGVDVSIVFTKFLDYVATSLLNFQIMLR